MSNTTLSTTEKQYVFLVGAKNIGSYGGYETFVEKLTKYNKEDSLIKYYVACKSSGTSAINENDLENVKIISDTEFIHNNAKCFKVNVPNIGAAQAIYYDVASLHQCLKYIEQERIKNPIVYILTCRIGFFLNYFYKKIHKLGGKIFLNPDGHEWLREKWSYPIKKYWKLSEKLMVKHSDLIICDSLEIESYIHKMYKKYNPKTTFIPYGAEMIDGKNFDTSILYKWYEKYNIVSKNYYLIVCRFVPENNFETIIREYVKSNTKKDLVIITTNNPKFMSKLEAKLHFSEDKRIKFVGTVYEEQLLQQIRMNAYAYIHGHEVGGTNPSLLESLATTDINLLLNVPFNAEVGKNGVFYWSKKENNLSELINTIDSLSHQEIMNISTKAKQRIYDLYNWENIVNMYERIFI